MWLVFLLLIVILGILFSKIEANLYSVQITEKNADFKAVVSLKFFGILKIFNVYLNKTGLRFLNKKIAYQEIMSKREIKKVNKEALEMLKDFQMKLDKIDFTVKIGLMDMTLTNIAIVVLSGVLPVILQNRVKEKNRKYEILPDYQNLCLELKGRITISIKFLVLLKIYFKNRKTEIVHNKNKNERVKESF
ncbi:MAG: hypothetical protein IJ867_05410 [Clostridia bacterium]|nr:hypothetical protein [Clostridia bacterium]